MTPEPNSLVQKLAARLEDPSTGGGDPRIDDLLRLADELQHLPTDSTTEDFPESLGPFTLLRVLGRGGFGRVFLARDERTGRDVALKLPKTLDDACRRRLVAEARTVARLDHPNIVTLLEAGEFDGRTCLIYIYVPGPTLADWITSKGPIPRDVAVRILLGIAAGVAHAHAHGILHRDLKPSNVILVEGGAETPTPRVLDFGLAKAMVQNTVGLTPTGHAVGTPPYAAPEQLLSDPSPTAAVDVFSLGMILSELLCGRCPSPAGVYRGDYVPLDPALLAPPSDADLARFIGRCLSFQPAARPQSVADFARELEDYLRQGPWSQLRRRFTRAVMGHRLKLIGLTLGVLIATIITLLLYFQTAAQASALRLMDAKPGALLAAATDSRPWMSWAARTFRHELARKDASPERIANAWLGLVPTSPKQAVPNAILLGIRRPAADLRALIAAIAPHRRLATPQLWQVAADLERDPEDRLCAASCLAALSPDDEPERWRSIAAAVANHLTAKSEADAIAWFDLLLPARNHFEDPLYELASRRPCGQAGRIAMMALSHFWADDPARLLAWLRDCDPIQIRSIALSLARNVTAEQELVNVVQRRESSQTIPGRSIASIPRARANAALAAAVVGSLEGLDLLFKEVADPTTRSQIYYDLGATGVATRKWIREFLTNWDRCDSDVLFGRLLCVAKLAQTSTAADRAELAALIDPIYEQQRDPGVHAAAAYALNFADPGALDAANARLSNLPAPSLSRWFHGPEGHIFAVLESPATKRRFALAMYSTSNEQFCRFQPAHLQRHKIQTLLHPKQPVGWVPLEEMRGYCDWLSKRLMAQPDLRVRLPKLQRFRLPTVEELSFAARGLATTPLSCGSDLALINDFAGFIERREIGAVKMIALAPNRLGMADLIGNMQQLADGATADQLPPKTFLFGFSYRRTLEIMGNSYCKAWKFPIEPEIAQTVTFRIAATMD